MSLESQREVRRAYAAFRTTRWTMILQAARTQVEDSRAAFSALYSDYWPPLCAYIRRRGYSSADAEDLAQSFFKHILERESLAGVTPGPAKFRSFLLRSVDNFLANEWDRAHAQKRGGGQLHVSWQDVVADADVADLAQDGDTPETVFERQWMSLLLSRALEELARECADGGKQSLFEALQQHLPGDRSGEPYEETGARLGMSVGAVKVAVHRLRQRFKEHLRAEILRTVASADEVDEELRHLVSVASRSR